MEKSRTSTWATAAFADRDLAEDPVSERNRAYQEFALVVDPLALEIRLPRRQRNFLLKFSKCALAQADSADVVINRNVFGYRLGV